MSYTEIIRLGNGVVIPSDHNASSVGTISNPKLKEYIKTAAENGFYFEGCGEDNCGGGEGRERNFLNSLGISSENNGTFDDLDLGFYNGYVMFSNIEANKETLNKLLGVQGDTVKDVIVNAANQGIATQNSLPVSNIGDFETLLDSNFSEEELSAEPTPENIINFLKNGESLMWDNYDVKTGGPEGSLSDYAKQGTKLRRENLKNKLMNGGVAFIGDGHIPELMLDFPQNTQVIGNLSLVDEKLQEEIIRIKELLYL
jgi:hypothetical protein